MDKVTQVNIEGHNYGFVAGQAVKGSCASVASDWVKTIVLPEGVTLVEGMVVATLFLNTNSAGFSDSITIYSSSGNVYYYDPEMTQVVDLPPYEDCYVITHIEGTSYKYEAYPVAVINGVRVPVCDSRGKPCGGPIWSGGDTIASLYLDDKLLMLHSTTINTLQEGSTLPVTSGAVKAACEDLYDALEPVNSVTSGVMKAVTSNAVAYMMNTWVDISSQVSLSIRNNNASVTIGHKKVYKCGSLLKFDIYCDCNTSGLPEGADLCQIVVTSSLFTLPYSLSRAYNPSYYGQGVTTIGMNVYDSDNGVITARLTKGGITIGDFSFCATIPCLIS